MENIQALPHANHDAFKDYLENLPEWDGVERIDNMLRTLFPNDHPWMPKGHVKSEHVSSASRFLFIAPTDIAYKFGYPPIEKYPLLAGASGIGKSQMLRNLLPPEHSGWFNGTLSLHSTRRLVEDTQGAIIAEWSDCHGLSPKHMSIMTDFLRAKRHTYRRPYGKEPKIYDQLTVVIGTRNSAPYYPAKSSIWRCFKTVFLGEANEPVETWLNENREQCWAEAVARVKDGERAIFPEETT